MPPPKVLYISYDGMGDPLGKSQVLPCIKKLSKSGVEIFLLSFEKKIAKKTELNKLNIIWIPVKYHKGCILVKLWDMVIGICLAVFVINKHRIKIIHCRGYFSTFIAFCLKFIFPISYIFDMRGLWVDERIDGGTLKRGSFKYCVAKWIEKRLLISASKIVVLTQAMRRKLAILQYLKEKVDAITVIPTCVDLQLFRPDENMKKLPSVFKGKLVVSYFGSIGTFYNFSALIDFYKYLSVKFKNAYLLVMTNTDSKMAEELIHKRGIPRDRYYLGSVQYEEVAEWLRSSDISLIFYNRKYSKEGCCPTKLGESLACGVPVVINDGIGDCSSIIRERGVGIIVKDFNGDSYARAAEEAYQLLKDKPSLSRRCRTTAEELFSLDEGAKRYQEIYKKL